MDEYSLDMTKLGNTTDVRFRVCRLRFLVTLCRAVVHRGNLWLLGLKRAFRCWAQLERRTSSPCASITGIPFPLKMQGIPLSENKVVQQDSTLANTAQTYQRERRHPQFHAQVHLQDCWEHSSSLEASWHSATLFHPSALGRKVEEQYT